MKSADLKKKKKRKKTKLANFERKLKSNLLNNWNQWTEINLCYFLLFRNANPNTDKIPKTKILATNKVEELFNL